MTLYVVATPIGNLKDITLRALEVLSEVPIIAAEDTRSARHLLEHHRVRAGREPPRLVSFFEGNEAARTAELLTALTAGEDVALISEAGLPSVSDPGQRLVAAARAAGVKVVVVPGACAALTALIGSGFLSERFLFVGFLPRKKSQRLEVLAGMAHEPGTLIFYESKERLAETLQDLQAVLSPERRACVARELTKLYEEYAIGTLGELLARYGDAPPRGEVTLLVEGYDAEKAASADSATTQLDLEAEIKERLRAGQGPKEIAAALALRYSYPRRKLYQLALALRV